MLRRIRSRISSAHVIATIALFAALGGGYATAFKGSGTLQKAAENGISQSFEDVRTLKGFGTLRARCDTADDEIEYQLKNTTGHTVQVKMFREHDGAANITTVAAGEAHVLALGSGGSFFGTMRFHLYRITPDNKAQVDIVASNGGPIEDNCNVAFVRILALNTQQ